MKAADIPEFGPLSGLRVVQSGNNIAGPFAGQLMAEFGADVIFIENPVLPDNLRTETAFEQERRNQRNIGLNLKAPKGQEILFKLLESAAVFIESSRGGQMKKWGLSDEVLWQSNPALVIVHVSGYGQSGVPEYVSKPSYDSIAQAFSGYMNESGFPDRPPVPAPSFVADYLTALFALTAAQAALYRAQKTGEGESIDCAQVDVMLRVQGWYLLDYLNSGRIYPRGGEMEACVVGHGVFGCGDGKFVFIQIAGVRPFKAAVELLGLEYGSPDFPEGVMVLRHDSPGGVMLQRGLLEYCQVRLQSRSKPSWTHLHRVLSGHGLSDGRPAPPFGGARCVHPMGDRDRADDEGRQRDAQTQS
jgi:L-carnitine CoA-transferase